MFYNVEARRIGGAGHTDIECLYLTKKKKFAVESKSTANKLSGINVGRLREHREEIGGEYTIVITPRYVPAAKRDIKGTDVVIVLASTVVFNWVYSTFRAYMTFENERGNYDAFFGIIVKTDEYAIKSETQKIDLNNYREVVASAIGMMVENC